MTSLAIDIAFIVNTPSIVIAALRAPRVVAFVI
jgi:hypothetical protein